MDDKIKHIIDSGLLEAYFLGLTDDKQSQEIDMLLEDHPELKKRQDAFDDLLLDLTGAVAKPPPADLRGRIKSSIVNDTPVPMPTLEKSNVNRWFPLAASLLLLGFAWVAYSNFKTAKDLSNELAEVRKELKLQKIQNLEMSSQISKLADEFAFVNDAQTLKLKLDGNAKAKELSMVAYWNNTSQRSMVSIDQYPDLPAQKCLQMWADVDGKMISVGILDPGMNYANIDFLENATSLNITIEPKGGSDHPNVANLVANVLL